MKELSIEEKAKAYDEAIEKAHQLCTYPTTKPFISDLQDLFPELKESDGESGDEKIRKEMIEIIRNEAHEFPASVIAHKSNSWIAWLEKQESNKLEKYINDERNKKDFYCAGKEMSWNEMPLAIRKNDYPYYFKGDLDCYPFNVEKQGGQKSYASETMNEKGDFDNGFTRMMEKEQKPADKVEPKFKVGDWVVRGKTIAQILDIQEQYYIGLDINGNDFTSSRFLNDDKIHLWAIQDAKAGDVLVDEDNNIGIYKEVNGIYWDSYIYLGYDGQLRGFSIGGSHEQTDTHPATKEQRDFLFKKMKEAGYEWDAEKKELKKIEQKPTDSIPGDFEKYVEQLLSLSDGEGHGNPAKVKEVSLKLLKLAKIEQKPAENSAKVSESSTEEKDMSEYKKGFECGKQRVLKYPEDFGLCKKPAWSEEDEMMIKFALTYFRMKGATEDSDIIKWLKSLRPQNRWKPSDGQMEALRYVTNFDYGGHKATLVSLYEQLKKLKG